MCASTDQKPETKWITGHLTCRYSLILIDALLASSTNSLIHSKRNYNK